MASTIGTSITSIDNESTMSSSLGSSCVVITYNCGKARQDDQNVLEIVNEALARSDNRTDIIAFCLQEVAPLIDSCLDWTDDWLGPFRKAVPDSYNSIAESVSGACAVLVFANNIEDVAHVDFDRTAFGALWSSLKGAALVSIGFREPKGGALTIISAHLCANEGNKEPRDNDFKYMQEDFELDKLRGQVIIAGDLNYRTTDGTIDTDELRSGMHSRGLAPGYTEGTIAFKPTYKFHVGTNNYNATKRTPSFCDRVLIRDFKGAKVVRYDSLELPDLQSDHKPVVAVIETLTRTRQSGNHWVLDETDPSDDELEWQQQHHQQRQQHDQQHDTLISIVPRRPSNLTVPRIRTLFSDTLIGIALFTFTTRKGIIALAALTTLFLLSRL